MNDQKHTIITTTKTITIAEKLVDWLMTFYSSTSTRVPHGPSPASLHWLIASAFSDDDTRVVPKKIYKSKLQSNNLKKKALSFTKNINYIVGMRHCSGYVKVWRVGRMLYGSVWKQVKYRKYDERDSSDFKHVTRCQAKVCPSCVFSI